MATDFKKRSSTSISLGRWALREGGLVRAPQSSDTSGHSRQEVVLVQGRYVQGIYGESEVSVSVVPATVERKLAIRQINEQLQGRTLQSNTIVETKSGK